MIVRKRVVMGVALVALLTTAGCNGDRDVGRNNLIAEEDRVQPRSGIGTSAVVRPVPHLATLPEGTILAVRTTRSLSTHSQVAGQTFTAHLVKSLSLNGKAIASRGAEVEGQIIHSDNGGRVKDVATIAVELTKLRLLDGQLVDIATSTLAFEARTDVGMDATRIVAGSAGGTTMRATAGGGAGAVLATYGEPAVIPRESQLNFILRSPAPIVAER